MEKLTDEEIKKLREVAETWEQVHWAVKFLECTGKLIGWASGIVIAIISVIMLLKGSGK